MFVKVSIAAHAALLLLLLRVPPLTIAVLSGYLVYHVVLALGMLHPRSALLGPNLSRLETRERVVALTFDDGPHPEITPAVLDILRARGVPATFFVVGRWVERYPEVVRRMVEEGHEVANHTYTHPYHFWTFPGPALAREIARAERAIRDACGRRSRFFRAPVGMKNCLLSRVLRRSGLALVSWDVRFLDRAHHDPARLRGRLDRRLVPGSIVMMHDGHDRKREGNPAVVEKLPVVLDLLEEKGYRCVTLAYSDR